MSPGGVPAFKSVQDLVIGKGIQLGLKDVDGPRSKFFHELTSEIDAKFLVGTYQRRFCQLPTALIGAY